MRYELSDQSAFGYALMSPRLNPFFVECANQGPQRVDGRPTGPHGMPTPEPTSRRQDADVKPTSCRRHADAAALRFILNAAFTGMVK
jgi:hypothetical protein